MASMAISMSESIQASIIIQHQLQQQLHQQNPQCQPQRQEKSLSLCTQIVLAASLIGIESCVCFEQVYAILFLQYLGVPLALVSINGIICGGSSMFLLPLVAFLTDKGSNPKLRKIFSLFLGMALFIFGLVLLAVCGFLKLSTLEYFNYNDTVTTSDEVMGSTPVFNQSEAIIEATFLEIKTKDPSLDMTTSSIPYFEDYSLLPPTAFISILAFVFLDMGFDIGLSLSRAFILQCTPSSQHMSLLVTATTVQSAAGTVFSLIGCFDLPGLLGSIFHANGVASTIIFLSCLLFVIIVTGFTCTIITGYNLNRKTQATTIEQRQHSRKSLKSQRSTNNTEFPVKERKRFFKLKAHKPLQQRPGKHPYVADILHTEEGDTSTKPLLLEDSLKNNYDSASVSTFSLCPYTDSLDARNERTNSISLLNVSSESLLAIQNKEDSKTENKIQEINDEETTDLLIFEPQALDHGASLVMAAIRQSYSMSQSTRQEPLGDFHHRKLEELNYKKNSKNITKTSKTRQHRRLIILCVSSFFAVGSLLALTSYISNAVTIGIYEGDPTAMPGTDGYELYKLGLRKAAIGNVIMFVSYTAISVSNKKIIDLIGEKLEFVLIHVLIIASLLALLITQLEYFFFLFMLCLGTFRSCVYTLPFVLANKFAQEQKSGENLNSDQPVKNIGKIMSLIGFLIPSHYMVLSLFMGPAMDSTGNVWIPLIYSVISAMVSLLLFLPLFVFKN